MPFDDRHIILPIAVRKIIGEGMEKLQWLKLMEKKKQCKKNLSKIKSLIFAGSNRLKQVYNADEADKIYSQFNFYYQVLI